MKYFITGHTGFKGAWLSYILKLQGHKVYGLSLEPSKKSVYNFLNLEEVIDGSTFQDIRHYETLKKSIENVKPDVLVHMAAQPLVIESYKNPKYTFETNVNGTLNVLNSIKNLESLKMALIVTSDKVYKNRSKSTGYKEDDELGGRDPYSASKSMADLLAQSWIKSFNTPPIAIVRAGNVIGGGDFSENRLIPDLVRHIFQRNDIIIRNPDAIRPWQHVFDCLNGYLRVIDFSITNNISDVWNFGPESESIRKVSDVISRFENRFKINYQKENINSSAYYEENILLLDSDKAYSKLSWKNKFNFEEACDLTLSWYEQLYLEKNIKSYSIKIIKDFFN